MFIFSNYVNKLFKFCSENWFTFVVLLCVCWTDTSFIFARQNNHRGNLKTIYDFCDEFQLSTFLFVFRRTFNTLNTFAIFQFILF